MWLHLFTYSCTQKFPYIIRLVLFTENITDDTKHYFPFIVSVWVRPFIVKLLCFLFLNHNDNKNIPMTLIKSLHTPINPPCQEIMESTRGVCLDGPWRCPVGHIHTKIVSHLAWTFVHSSSESRAYWSRVDRFTDQHVQVLSTWSKKLMEACGRHMELQYQRMPVCDSVNPGPINTVVLNLFEPCTPKIFLTIRKYPHYPNQSKKTYLVY